MAKVKASGAVITVGGTNVSTYVESYEIEWAVDVIQGTGFSDGWQNYFAGIPVVGITLNTFWEKTAGTGTFAKFVTLMTTPATVSIVPEATGPTLSGTFMCDGVHPGGSAHSGAITLGSVHFSPSGTAVATFA